MCNLEECALQESLAQKMTVSQEGLGHLALGYDMGFPKGWVISCYFLSWVFLCSLFIQSTLLAAPPDISNIHFILFYFLSVF